MSAVIENSSTSMAAKALQGLAGGMDTPIADTFLDFLFELAATLGDSSCTLANDHALHVNSQGMVLHEAEIPRAKTKLRMLCARLSVRCGELTKRSLSPYGDTVEIEIPSLKKTFKICFENTTSTQEIVIVNI